MEELIKLGKHALVLAIGGGGDIASASVIAKSLERRGLRCTLASIAWERFVVDPVPGPIRIEEFEAPVSRGKGYVVVNDSSYAVRGGRRVVPQAVNTSRVLGVPVFIPDMYGGVKGYLDAVIEIMDTTGADFVVGVDVGGDSLATGCEENLWSPLADWMGLAVIAELKGVLAVHSPGSDGELDQEYILTRIDEVSSRGGLISVNSMSSSDAELLEKVLIHVNSEASYVPLLAYKGFRGIYSLRKGSRSVRINFFNTLTFYLDASLVARGVKPVEKLFTTQSLDEAKRTLNELGIYTELNLEEDLASLKLKPEDVSAEVLVEVRRRGLERLGKTRYCTT